MARHRIFRWFAILTTFFLIAAGCSKPPSSDQAEEGSTNLEDKVSTLDDTDTADPTAEVEGGPTTDGPDAAAQGGEGDGPTNPGADSEHARRVGSLIQLQSTEKVDNSWAGVTADTIKWVFTYDAANCGVNTINAISQAGGNFANGSRWYRPAPTDQSTANEETRQSIDALVKYWNANARATAEESVPNAIPVMDRYNTPGHPFYGRKLAAEVIDGGSYQCPEKTTSAAKRIAQEIKPFVVATNDVPGLDGSGYNMAAGLNAEAPRPDCPNPGDQNAVCRPMHFGSLHLSDKFYKQWAPFVWTQFTSGTASARAHASWICSRLEGKNAEFSPQYRDTPRKWGLAYPNNPNGNQVANEFKGFIEEFCGEQIFSSDNEFRFSQDPSRAPDEGTQMAIKFKLNGVTSLVYFLDPISPLFHINVGMRGQEYRPELVWSATAYYDSTTVQRLYDQSWVDGNSIGTSAFGQPGGWGGTGPGDPFWTWHETHKVAPNGQPCDPNSNAGMMHSPDFCRAPGAIVTWYYSILPLIGGTYFAGPDLTPQRVTDGLQEYPLTRYGVDGPTDNPHAALVGAGKGQYHFIVDYHAYRWRSKFISPAPTHQDGWVEFPPGPIFECQKHYLEWPDKVAPQWEGHDDCGGEQFAPPAQHPGDPPVDGHTHDGSYEDGTYERDNYPNFHHWTE